MKSLLKINFFPDLTRFVLLGLPDPPIKVELCDWDVDHMDLQWGFPPSDGGAPIIKYKVTIFKTSVNSKSFFK